VEQSPRRNRYSNLGNRLHRTRRRTQWCKDVDFGQGLREVSKLSRVSHQFHTLLSKSVRVNSCPVMKYLMSLQVSALSSIFELLNDNDVQLADYPYRHHAWRNEDNDWQNPDIENIRKRCGSVWNGPAFPKLFTRVLEHEEWICPSLLYWFMFQAPFRIATVLNESKHSATKHLPCGNLCVGKMHTGSAISFTVGR